MLPHRRLALVAGAVYLVSFATAIPALALKAPFLEGSAGPASAHWAAVLEVVLAVSCLGTALALYPVGRRHAPALAVGFVASRAVESSVVLVGVVALLSVATLRAGQGGGGDAEAALVAVHDWAFLLGPGLLPAVNAALLGTLLYRARLVPRAIPLLGLVGAPLLAASAVATVLGIFGQVSVAAAVAALPIALWELSLGVWLVAKGFLPDAVAGPAPATAPDAAPDIAPGTPTVASGERVRH